MITRLRRRSRLHATRQAVIKEGREHGRDGWVTQSIVAHAMMIRPGCYVLGLLNELHRSGVLHKTKTQLPSGTWRHEFCDAEEAIKRDGIPF